MKTKVIAIAVGALIVSLLLGAACAGGNGGEEAGVRIQKGLGVAALVANAADRAGGAEGGTGDDVGAPGSPPVTDNGKGGGMLAPDFFPYPYPSFQQSQSGVTVQGYGSASVAADSAVLEFYFGGKVTGVEPVPDTRGEPGAEGGGSGAAPSQQEAQPITEADLQPVVDAIVAAGVSRDDVEVTVQPYYGDPYYGGSATIRATVRNIDAVQAVVNAATEASVALPEITLQGTNVSYTVSDCAALELSAMQAAVEDARERGASFASALGVGLGDVVGASHYTYSGYGGTPCDAGFGGPVPLGGVTYAEGQAAEVQVIANVAVTFSIR